MEFALNASKLHKLVGQTLENTPGFSGSELQQEVIVSKLFPEYPNNKDRYDWVIPSRFTIIECHGIQHYKIQSFGSSADEAVMNFQTQKFRDSQKKEIALLNGWTYIEIPYTDIKKITPEYLMEAYKLSYNSSQPKASEPKQQSKYHIDQLEKARQYRKQQYQKMKVKKNEYSRSRTRTTDPSDEEA